jgi:hypothetical protein
MRLIGYKIIYVMRKGTARNESTMFGLIIKITFGKNSARNNIIKLDVRVTIRKERKG